MVQIDATPAGPYAVNRRAPDVLVGDIDTGLDFTHIRHHAANVDSAA